ncbi:hypothetical protein C5167_013593 [Papaver somniferum]|uniref:Uncharacterized protein n=1 Tax=Papaver somniferum TaxID=3469 RepID=A0A4Y7J3T3_PAPSO|nr:hypothetical protein C5167_013593 [Papaver somniferum]
MVGDGGKSQSRNELLKTVREHSKFLGQTIVDEKDTSDVEADSRFWYDLLDKYFSSGVESRLRQDDDLIFFVKKLSLRGSKFNNNAEGTPPFFVRRWAPKLDKVIENPDEVDWRRSFYLNLIAHTSFTVIVAICSIQDLQNHQNRRDTPLSPVYKGFPCLVADRVESLTDDMFLKNSLIHSGRLLKLSMRHLVVSIFIWTQERQVLLLSMHLFFSCPDFTKSKCHAFYQEDETVPAYPDICFAVDDFDSTFDAVVLTETDHCYCVLLNGHDGAAFPTEQAVHDCSSSKISSLRVDIESGRSKNSKVTLFSGFVSYEMVREAYDAGKFRFGSLFSLPHFPSKTDRLYMTGPGGRGEVEVAVSGVADQSHQTPDPPSPLQTSKTGFGIGVGTIVRKAASAASVAAKHAYATASSTGKANGVALPLKCCLMSISLPWEDIAHDLLFKVCSSYMHSF